MNRRPWRLVRALLVLLILPGATAIDVDAAMAFLDDAPANAYQVEAALAARHDPRAWPAEPALSGLRIPEGGGIGPLRALVAAAAAGAQHVDGVAVADRIAANHDAALASSNDAALAFQIHAWLLVGQDGPEVDALATRLATLHDDGLWACGGAVRGIECTGYAATALHAAGHSLPDATRGAAMALQNEAGGFGASAGCPGGDTQQTAWGLQVLRVLGQDEERARGALAANQRPDGGFCRAHASDAWATQEAVVAWQGTYPPRLDPGPAPSNAVAWTLVALMAGAVLLRRP